MLGTREPGIGASVKEGVSRRNGNLLVEPLEDTGPRARETGTGGLVLSRAARLGMREDWACERTGLAGSQNVCCASVGGLVARRIRDVRVSVKHPCFT